MIVRLAPVQTFIAQKATQYLSAELKTKVYVGGFHLSWFFEVALTDVEILDLNNNVILKSKLILADVGKINIDGRKLFIDEILLEDTETRLVHYANDSVLNIAFIIHYFSPKQDQTDTSSSAPWQLNVGNVKLINNHFIYIDEKYMHAEHKGINFSNLDISNLNADIRYATVMGDSIIAKIKNLSFEEQSGFCLQKFVADATVSSKTINARDLIVVTPNSHIVGDVRFDYQTWHSLGNFIDEVQITSFFHPTILDMHDIAYFAPDIAGMDNIFLFSGNIKGKVSSFSATDFEVKYGAKTKFLGNVKMTGLPHFDETFMHFNISEFKTQAREIRMFKLPKGATIKLPKEMDLLGNISVAGKFTGFYTDFISNATFKTDAGSLITNITMTNNSHDENIGYNGKIIAQHFDIGKVFSIKELGKISLTANVKGKNFTADQADVDIDGNLSDIEFNGNLIEKIDILGKYQNRKFTGKIDSQDKLLNLDLNGSIDMTQKMPAYNFESNVKNINLAALKLWKNDSIASFSGKIISNFSGNSINALLGQLNITEAILLKGNNRLYMKELFVNAIKLDETSKRLKIKNDFFDAEFIGNYAIEDFDDYARAILKKYLPSLYNGKIEKTMDIDGGFDYILKLNNTKPLTQIFLPDLTVDSTTVVKGWFNPGTYDMKFICNSKKIKYDKFLVNNLRINGYTQQDDFAISMETSSIDALKKNKKKEEAGLMLEKYKLTAVANNDIVSIKTSWGKAGNNLSKGEISTNLSFKEFPRLSLITPKTDIFLNDTLWKNLPNNLIVIDTNRISIQNLGFYTNGQQITLNGALSKDPTDKITLTFKQFNISNIDMLTLPVGLDFDGIFNGSVVLSNAYAKPKALVNLDVRKMYLNKEFLGDADINSVWDNEISAIDVDVRIVDRQQQLIPSYPLKINGKVYLKKKQDNFDLTIDINKLKLGLLQPFVAGLFSKVAGATSGLLKLTGGFDAPVVAGKLKMQKMQMLMGLLGTTYTLDGDVLFDKNKISVKNLPLTDSIGNTGKLNGTVTHKFFKDFSLNLKFKLQNLAALNTNFSPHEVYYGKALASGDVDIEGTLNNLNVGVFAKPEKGTQVFVPIRYSIALAKKDFIRYQAHSAEETFVYDFNEKSTVNLDLLLDVTPNAEVNILLPDNLGDIRAKGHGLIDLGINTRGENKMHGLYVMDEGDFKLNLQNIFKRNFKIRQGSTIAFNGSPTDASVNLKAEYSTKTSLSGLPNITPELVGERVLVKCVVSLQNSLMKPEMRFSIELPNATEHVKQAVFNTIDTTNASAMNQQLISLLALNTFATTSGIVVNEERLGNTSYDFLNNQINNFLSQVIKDIDIGINYRPGSQISQEELGLMFSKKINERLSISGNVGRNVKGVGEEQVSRVIGDFLVEYNLTKDGTFILKAFNKTNSLYDFNNQAPYTQGVGIMYRKEFNNVKELWKRKKKNKTDK